MSLLDKDEERKKDPDITDLLNFRIFGIDFGQILRSWLGVEDLAGLQDPACVEEIKRRVEERREELRKAQEQLRKKYGDAIRFDYDIRVKTLLGGRDEFRIGGGKFFERLDELAGERAQWKSRPKPQRVMVPSSQEEVIEPLVEATEGKETVEVIVDLPGVEEKDIALKIEQDNLIISASRSNRKYRAEMKLPAKVLEEPSEKRYVNGVLRVKFKKSVQR